MGQLLCSISGSENSIHRVILEQTITALLAARTIGYPTGMWNSTEQWLGEFGSHNTSLITAVPNVGSRVGERYNQYWAVLRIWRTVDGKIPQRRDRLDDQEGQS